jgi:hypothetical protein
MFLDANCPSNKIDSNVTGLRYAWEECLKELPANPVWHALEPNSYNDFGATINTVARNPINPSRQRKKGTTVGVDATGGFNQDLTFNNLTDLLQGFFFAGAREKATTQPLNAPAVVITGVTTANDTYAAASGLAVFTPGDIVLASGFGVTANNGLKTVTAATAGTVVVTEDLADEPNPPAGASLVKVGRSTAAGVLGIAMNGQLVRLTATAGLNLASLGLIPGEWIFVGGDGANQAFDNNVGFGRVSVITSSYIEFDKVTWAPQAEAAGGTKAVQLYFGTVIRNEPDPALIKRGSLQLERTLGQDASGTMSEYLVGAVPNELTLNVAQEAIVSADLSFVACDSEQRSGSQGLKPGTRPSLTPFDAFNTTSDFSRIKLASVSNVNAAPTPLFAFATDMTLSVNNNVSANKAIGVMGAMDLTAGTFEVGGEITAYFASVAAVQAVRNNADITLDVIMVKSNRGLLFDIPLLSLGNGRLNVEQDQAITVPLETNAAESKFGHTLLFQSFPYLPSLAA